MDTFHPGKGPACSRRRFTTGLAAGAGGLALGGLGFTGAPLVAQTIQLGGTPTAPAVPVAAPPASESVEEAAARLGYDHDTIVDFVRGEIAYEAYDGILRGAQGTLSARAGNSADQAVLLAELFAAALIPHRFAVGALDDTAAEILTSRLARTTSEASASWDAAETASLLRHLGLDELPATPPALDPEVEAIATRFEGYARAAVDLALSSTEISTTAIAAALSEGGITLPPLPDATLPDSERMQHVWIQVADGPNWIDVDPSLPADAAPPPATETVNVPPIDWYHQLRFAITADEWRSGSVQTREVVALTAVSSRLVDAPVALSMASADELTEVGSSITQVLSGQKTIYPSIYVDGLTVNAETPIIFATDAANAQDPFAGSEPGVLGEGETIAVWLQVEIRRPGAEQVVIHRPLLDRLSPEDRAGGTVDPERVASVKTVPTGIGDDTIQQFNTLVLIHTDVARIPPTDAIVRYGEDQVFGALGMLGPTLAGLRDLLGVRLETEAGTWSYPSAPNVTVFHATPGDQATGDGRASLTADLLYRQRTSFPLSDATPAKDVHPLVLSGVLDAVAEQVLLAPEFRGQDADTTSYATGPSVAGIFGAAAATGQASRLVSTPTDLATVELDPLARSRLEAELAAGRIVVIPSAPVDFGGSPVLGWWIVDPATGRTRDELQSGLAGASTSVRTGPTVLFGNTPGYTFLMRAIAFLNENAHIFACLGGASAVSFLFTGSLLLLADAAQGLGSMAAASASVVIAGGGSIAGWALACA